MVSFIDLVMAMADRVSEIPEVMALLAPAKPIRAYVDLASANNSLDLAIYQIQPGQLLVVWTETFLVLQTLSQWSHRVEICIRALKDHSDHELAQKIVNGVPQPGNRLPWRFCPLIDGVLPTNVTAILRRTDTEGVDYTVIQTETAETGDWLPQPL